MFFFPPENIIKLFIAGIYNRLKSRILRLSRLTRLNLKHKNKIDSGNKKDIFMIHHLACTGGSLISKIIRDSFNCVLVSEINPGYAFGSHIFSPYDLLSQFAYASNKSIRTIKKAIENYNLSIDFCMENIDLDQFLVIRDWSEGDFYESKILPHICSSKDWIDSHKYNIHSIITVRHPIESFLSKAKYNWEEIKNENALEVYCRKYIDFLNHYQDSEIFYYEKICSNYESEIKKISKNWGKKFNKIKSLSNKKISGDSGRSSLSISLRPSKKITKEIKHLINCSDSYFELCSKLGYKADLDTNSLDYFI